MATRAYALIFGLIYAGVGIMGFIPTFLTPHMDHPALMVESNYGLLLGLFPVNTLHSIVHLLTGLVGVVASRRFIAARNYCRAIAIIFGLLTLMGLIPGLNTTFGLIPLYGNDVWLHALTTVA